MDDLDIRQWQAFSGAEFARGLAHSGNLINKPLEARCGVEPHDLIFFRRLTEHDGENDKVTKLFCQGDRTTFGRNICLKV